MPSASLGLQIGLDRDLGSAGESLKPGGPHPPIGPRRGIRGLAGAIFLSEGVDVTREWLQRLFEDAAAGCWRARAAEIRQKEAANGRCGNTASSHTMSW